MMLRDTSVVPRLPILSRGRGFSITPMGQGLRLAGTVEIGGLDQPMNEERAYVLLRQAKAVLPGLETSDFAIWMGFRPSFPDSLPVIDEAPGRRGLFLAFGHGRHTGMTGGAPTGRLIKQLVAGEPAARNWLAQTSLAASVGGVNHPVEQGSSVSLSGDGNTAIVRQLQASINLALGSASQQAPHWRGRRNCDCDSLTWTVEASASAVAQRSSGNSDSVRGPG